ncbi:hypothetical protein GQ43DRAFT_148828 [Delitschia confertaspora ATCC 74209]|uniref:Uncharacterized protein n=1 Tax=Delitschia confertaspora ATCC 74209 TaxID=1513339 RepID=A0A9P4JFX9_9PLEO|nr:hypothetical protein GQ43DRAFT_148828 [Delitschia confertaspora ATCC 74209]
MGMGKSVPCSEYINEVINSKDEWEKMGSQAATTLMTLLPTFLAFGNLYVPRSSEAYATSALVGLTTAFFTFGLPARSMSAVKQSNSHNLGVLGIAALAFISTLGKRRKDGTAIPHKLADLQSWSDDESLNLKSWSDYHNHDVIKVRFGAIKARVNGWQKRWHFWHIPAILVAAVPMNIFGWGIYPLFQNLGVPKFILRCYWEDAWDWTGFYLGASAGVNTIIRYLLWKASHHEQMKVYSLSGSAQKDLNQLISATDIGETTATHLPPLQPLPFVYIRTLISGLFGRCRGAKAHHPRAQDIFLRPLKLIRRRFLYITKGFNFCDVIQAGFMVYTKSGRRWRPIYILIHFSHIGHNPLSTLVAGFIEGGLLLVLTFFFAAQWGGNLVFTMIALSLLLVFVTIGRFLSFLYVWLSSQIWGLTVLECDSVDEIRGVMRILCSMEGVLVAVNGAKYFGVIEWTAEPGSISLLRTTRGESLMTTPLVLPLCSSYQLWKGHRRNRRYFK